MVVVGGSIPPRQVVQVCPPQPQQTMTPYSSAQAPPPAPPAGKYGHNLYFLHRRLTVT
jgi:hypothetical protein